MEKQMRTPSIYYSLVWVILQNTCNFLKDNFYERISCHIILNFICINVLLGCFFLQPVFAQETDLKPGIPQCAAIREVIFSASEKQFDNLMLDEGRGSHGYQVRGSWRFETVQYPSLLPWPGATRTYIDNSEESTDSSKKIIRQYVAEFAKITQEAAAIQKYKALNAQVAECRLPLGDSNIMVLKPIPLDKIKGDLPVAAIDATLYPVTIIAGTEASPGQEVVIMTAYEKIGRYYSAYMIVEYRLQQDWTPHIQAATR